MRELMDTQRQNFWTEAIQKEGKKRLEWLSRNDRQQFDDLSVQAAIKDDAWRVVTGKRHIHVHDKDDLLTDVGGTAALKGTSSDVIGTKIEGYKPDKERFAKVQLLQKSDQKEYALRKELRILEDDDGNAITLIEPPPEMRPSSEGAKKLLYDGFSKEGKGRSQYLQYRTSTRIPEERFDYTVTSNWEYGWQQRVKLAPPRYGRSRIVRETFFRTGGALKN